MRGIDLFCGARGWEARAHKSLGVDLLGVEYWEPAVLTSRAAGLRVLHADVSELDPSDFAGEVGDDGIMAGSPPCPTFSAAGRGSGKHLTGVLLDCARAMMDGRDTREAARAEAYAILLPVALEAERKRAVKAKRAPDEGKAQTSARRDAVMSVLVVEPLRFALALRPRAILLEQVPSVLPLWKAFGAMLSERGYSWWAGVLEAERFGVPQTRERAVLIARRDGVAAHPPTPTHQRYVPKEPQRHDVTLEGEVLPWVSMAEALGWDGQVRTGDNSAKHGRRPEDAAPYERSSEAPAPTVTGTTDRWRVAMRSNYSDGTTGERGEREASEPAFAVTSKVDRNHWIYDRRQVGGDGTPVGPRFASEPAPTIASQGLAKGRDRWLRNNSSENAGRRPMDEPAPTLFFGHACNEVGWVPAPDERVNKTGQPVTQEEAAILQSFPPDYPWQGDPEKPNSRTSQFTMIGNAVPPLLGQALLRTVAEGRERPT